MDVGGRGPRRHYSSFKVKDGAFSVFSALECEEAPRSGELILATAERDRTDKSLCSPAGTNTPAEFMGLIPENWFDLVFNKTTAKQNGVTKQF